MKKRAVVIGINDYSVQGVSNLSGCVRDAQSMYHLLVDAFGFDPDQTWLYTDRKASSQRMRKALNYMLSVSEPGDVACFYYAGHGGLHKVSDDTYYQTIIPASGRYISDYDLWSAAEELQQSEVNFTVVLDSCHSGGMHEESESPGMVRSVRFARELIEQIVAGLKHLIPFGVTVPNRSAYRNNARNVRRGNGNPQVTMEEDPNQQFIQLAKSTLFSACRWDQLAGETSSHGYFTQAILDTVNSGDFQMNHRSLHRALLARTNTLSSNAQQVQIRGQANRMEENFLAPWTDSR